MNLKLLKRSPRRNHLTAVTICYGARSNVSHFCRTFLNGGWLSNFFPLFGWSRDWWNQLHDIWSNSNSTHSTLLYSTPTPLCPLWKGALVLLLTLIVIDQLKEILHSLVFDQSYIFFLLLLSISLFCVSTYRDQVKSKISPTQLFCIWSPLCDFPPVLESR